MCIRDRLYPARDLLFYSSDIHGNLLTRQRMQVFKHLMEDVGGTVVTTVDGLMDHLLPLSMMKERRILVESGEVLDLSLIHILQIEMKEEIRRFAEYLEAEKHASENTRVSYQRDLMQMAAFLEGMGIRELSRVTRTALNSYVLMLEKEGKAASTVSRNLASMKAFFGYEFKRGRIRKDPSESIHCLLYTSPGQRKKQTKRPGSMWSQPSRDVRLTMWQRPQFLWYSSPVMR